MGFFNVSDDTRRRPYDPRLDEPEEDARPRRPWRREREDWIDVNEEGEYADADCSYDRALLDARRRRKVLKPGRPLTYQERCLIELLDELDAARRKAHEATLAVTSYLSKQGALRLTFERFLKAGGVNGDDLEAMIQSDFDRPPVKRRGPLRLVVSNRPKRKIKRRMLDLEKMKRNRRG
jgi:hypothetical protein